jgi:hypothetical protein
MTEGSSPLVPVKILRLRLRLTDIKIETAARNFWIKLRAVLILSGISR